MISAKRKINLIFIRTLFLIFVSVALFLMGHLTIGEHIVIVIAAIVWQEISYMDI